MQAFRDIIAIILNFFGIIYSWVFLGNPASKVGGGIGLAAGCLLGTVAASPWFPLVCVAGLVAGNLIGSGLYEWYQQSNVVNRQNQRQREYEKFARQNFEHDPPSFQFHVPADVNGNIVLEPNAPRCYYPRGM